VKLTVQENRAAAVRTLEHALDQGITHFDVARLYGFGQAENILGEFLRGKRDRVTVTTKFGLRPNQSIARHRRLISIARQVLRRVPAIERRIKQRMSAGGPPQGIYTPEEAQLSLDISLRELGTDYVDVFLMHEAGPADASPHDLLDHLEREVKRGRVRLYGLGSAANTLGNDLSVFPAGVRVLQFDSSALAPHVKAMRQAQGRALITFGVMSPLGPLLEYFQREPARVNALSDQAQLDFSNPRVLPGLLIDDALHSNPDGVALVATVRPEHIAANVQAAAGDMFNEAQRAAFAQLVSQVMQAQRGSEATGTVSPA
jgi:D-threo-aldose 1-dehydrogenase